MLLRHILGTLPDTGDGILWTDSNFATGATFMGNSSHQKNILPSSLRPFTARELFLYTRIPLWRLEGFITGRFKPNPEDREKLTRTQRAIYHWNQEERELYMARRKYRELRGIIDVEEKAALLDKRTQREYDQELDRLILKYWDEIAAIPIEQDED